MRLFFLPDLFSAFAIGFETGSLSWLSACVSWSLCCHVRPFVAIVRTHTGVELESHLAYALSSSPPLSFIVSSSWFYRMTIDCSASSHVYLSISCCLRAVTSSSSFPRSYSSRYHELAGRSDFSTLDEAFRSAIMRDTVVMVFTYQKVGGLLSSLVVVLPARYFFIFPSDLLLLLCALSFLCIPQRSSLSLSPDVRACHRGDGPPRHRDAA